MLMNAEQLRGFHAAFSTVLGRPAWVNFHDVTVVLFDDFDEITTPNLSFSYNSVGWLLTPSQQEYHFWKLEP